MKSLNISHLLSVLLVSASLAVVACQDGHDHDHDHGDHEHQHEHGDLSHSHDHEHGDHDHDHDHGHSADYVDDEEEHGHSHDRATAGPNGGRVLFGVEPHVEFFVTDDRKVKLTFVDDDLKPVALAEQTATVITGDRSAPIKLSFVREGDSLVSEGGLPEGTQFPVVVQLKMTPDAAPVIEKFNLDLSDCPSCDYQEYACTCAH